MTQNIHRIEHVMKKNFRFIVVKLKRNKLFIHFTARLSYWIISLLFITYRLKLKSFSDSQRFGDGLICCWHQNILAAAAFFMKNDKGGHCIASPSADGKFAGAVAKMLGFKVLYGSPNKSSTYLIRNSIKVLNKYKRLILVADGSRGPAKKLQRGIGYLSRKTNSPIFFIDCESKWKISLPSWDKFQIPLPFSKILIDVKKLDPGK